MTKAELRTIFRERRNDLTPADISLASQRIADQFFQNFDLSTVKVLSTFIRISRHLEIDTSAIYYRLWRDHPRIRTVAPSADLESGTIESVEFTAASEFLENRWGIREPLGACVSADEIDLVIVPLLCFDREGHRVGYGRGFYDRFLSECRSDCLKVGLSYFSAVERIDDVLDRDVRLDACITPEGVTRFRRPL